MSTVEDVETAWTSNVWLSNTIQRITDKVYAYDITQLPEIDVARFSYEQQINFFEWVVSRTVGDGQIGAVNGRRTLFIVEVRYTRQKDQDGTNQRAIRDTFDTLISLVYSALGDSWNSTVDLYRHQEGPVAIESAVLADIPVWRGTYTFEGETFNTI